MEKILATIGEIMKNLGFDFVGFDGSIATKQVRAPFVRPTSARKWAEHQRGLSVLFSKKGML